MVDHPSRPATPATTWRNAFNRLKQFRDLTTRYAKCAAYYRSELIIASLVLWLRMDLPDTA